MKKIVLIFLVLTMLTGVLAGCDRTENALSEQLRGEVEWYDYTTRIETKHVTGDMFILTAVHIWSDGTVQTDVYITLPDIDTGEYKFHNIYNGAQIN